MKGLSSKLADVLIEKKLTLTVAESCTGGWLAKILTDVPGSSAWFERGFVTYSNQAKQEMLGVPKRIIDHYGAVSYECAKAMAKGALKHSQADIALSITGIAGPEGGTKQKPVGLVWFAWSCKQGGTLVRRYRFSGDREMVRHHAVYYALETLLSFLDTA